MASLFSGEPQVAPSYVKTTQDSPKWFQDALFNQMAWAQTAANQPYQVYDQPRVSTATPDTKAAYQMTRENVGAWQPGMTTAMTGTEALTGQNAGVNTGLGYMTEGTDLTRGAAGQKMLPGVSNYINQAVATRGIDAANPYLNQASSATEQSLSERAMQYADPYMRAAGQSSASYIPQYMNPYNQAVTSQIANLGARNLSENLLPGVSDAFIRSGTFGGTRMGEFGQRALRDTQESVLNQQAQALQQGYGQALGAAQAESAKQAGLAGTAGQIAGADLSRILSGAGQYGQLGQTAGGLTNAQQQALLQSGQLYGSTGAQDIASQLQAGNQLANIGNQYAGTSMSEAQRQQSALQQLANQAQQQQGLMTADASALQAIGSAQQAQKQQELDAAYSSWKEQQDYPKTQLDWLNTQIRGMSPSVATGQTQQGYTTQYGPSAATQAAQGLATVAGLYNLSKP